VHGVHINKIHENAHKSSRLYTKIEKKSNQFVEKKLTRLRKSQFYLVDRTHGFGHNALHAMSINADA